MNVEYSGTQGPSKVKRMHPKGLEAWKNKEALEIHASDFFQNVHCCAQKRLQTQGRFKQSLVTKQSQKVEEATL